MDKKKIACFGEVLWDIFPSESKIGGAPLNVALRLKSFNNVVSVISKVGTDELGSSLINFLEKKGLDVKNVQIDLKLKTGEVIVKLDEKGSATYDIMFPRAWDYIKLIDSNLKLVADSDAFIFGSLIARNDVSKNTLFSLLDVAKYKVFDVNLRTPYYTKNLLIELMNEADFIKFNDEEILEISRYLGSEKNSIEENIAYISKNTNTKHICVTKGQNGAVLFYNGNLFYNHGYSINVKDTVGAGDSFLATLINHLLKKAHPQEAIDTACAVGAIVAQSEGANPEITSSDIKIFMKSK